jgi:hypothetical protein
MKEARELQTQIEDLARYITQQRKIIEAQKKLIKEQDEKIINLAFDLEYERHTNSLKGKK